jgi:hypothetical protein
MYLQLRVTQYSGERPVNHLIEIDLVLTLGGIACDDAAQQQSRTDKENIDLARNCHVADFSMVFLA